MKYYDRHVKQAIERQGKIKPVLIVTGPRQVGKSALLEILNPNITHVTLDDINARISAFEEPANFLAVYKPPVLINEIQKAPNLFDEIKLRVDKNLLPSQYFLTGAHINKLMDGVQESLGGRAGIIKMLGLSYREIKDIKWNKPFLPTLEHFESVGKNNPFDFDDIIKIIHKGSYPELYKYESNLDDWNDYYSSYVQAIIEKDVKDKINSENAITFSKFIKGVATLSGQLLNYTTLAEMCSMGEMTVKNWLSILEKCGLVYLLQPFSNNALKRLSKTPKLYFLDTGLVCYLGGWNTPDQLIKGAKWGHIFETYVISEILKSNYNSGNIRPNLSYYRDSNKNEVDLLIEIGDTIYPVEIKTSSNPTKNMIKSFKLLHEIPQKKIAAGGVICLSNKLAALGENSTIIPVTYI